LMGFGAILPFERLIDFVSLGVGFVFALFLAGSIYSLAFSFFIVMRNREKFWDNFRKKVRAGKYLISAFALSGFALFYMGYMLDEAIYFTFAGAFALVFPFLFYYVRSIEETCMVKYVSPERLTEGDWIEKDIKVGKRTIKKSVHGLSIEEIKLLRKHGKKVLIKEGIPFAPAFLFALIGFAIYLWYFPIEFF
jgi:hypothetical protein